MKNLWETSPVSSALANPPNVSEKSQLVPPSLQPTQSLLEQNPPAFAFLCRKDEGKQAPGNNLSGQDETKSLWPFLFYLSGHIVHRMCTRSKMNMLPWQSYAKLHNKIPDSVAAGVLLWNHRAAKQCFALSFSNVMSCYMMFRKTCVLCHKHTP